MSSDAKAIEPPLLALSPAEAARAVGGAEPAIRDAIDDGSLHAVYVGRRIKIPFDYLLAWVHTCRRVPKRDSPTGRKADMLPRPRR